MARISLVVCDVCKNVDRETKNYTVQDADRRRTLDLCTEHAKPLVTLLELDGATPAAPRRGRGRRGGIAVTTMEEIEAQKV